MAELVEDAARRREGAMRLRPLARRDAPRLARHCADPDLARMTTRFPYPYRLQDAEAALGVAIAGALGGVVGWMRAPATRGGAVAERRRRLGRSEWEARR